MERPNAWLTYSDADMQDLETVAKKYRHFLNVGKTERECITQIVKEAEEAGYVSLEEKVKNGEALKAGDKVYQVGMQKIIALYHIGEEDLAQGMNILCAHIDSPRLDIKQNPLYEDTDLAYLDTHYYGGVKKYQWVALPMAMHGVIVKKDGTVVNVTVGEDEDDPPRHAGIHHRLEPEQRLAVDLEETHHGYEEHTDARVPDGLEEAGDAGRGGQDVGQKQQDDQREQEPQHDFLDFIQPQRTFRVQPSRI